MKFGEIKDQIVTGDALLVDGTGIGAELIEIGTQGRFSHAAIFFRPDLELATLLGAPSDSGALYVAEMWQTKGFVTHRADQRLTESDGTCYIGVAPALVRARPNNVLEVIKKYLRDPEKHEYGWGTLPLVEAEHLNPEMNIDPDSVSPVCSILVEQCYQACGVGFKQSLADPSDFDGIVAGTVLIEA